MEDLAQTLIRSANALIGFGSCAGEVRGLEDRSLLEAQRALASHRRSVDAYAAVVAGEIARRSRYELGHAGLAQREGHKNAVGLIQTLGQTSHQEAARFVAVGTMMAEAHAATDAVELAAAGVDADGQGDDGEAIHPIDPVPGEVPVHAVPGEAPVPAGVPVRVGVPMTVWWQEPIVAALSTGALSAEAAEAIRRPLGEAAGTAGAGAAVAGTAGAGLVREAAARLVADAVAGNLSVEDLARRARRERDRLDADGVARREAERRDRRTLKTWWDAEGMYHLYGLLDPENGLLVDSALSTVLSPRTGGPRFVDKAEAERAQKLLEDSRTNEQIAADALVEMVRIAGDADTQTLFGSRRPAVRVIVPVETVQTRTGHGYFQDHPDPVSSTTAERHLCTDGWLPVVCDLDGNTLNLGRTTRLFTGRQRLALTLRDGGCRWPGCDRPASWCEAHHIEHWYRDHGRTDLADGILLCRHHHMLLHDNGWHIVREGGAYRLRPPKCVDPAQALRDMPTNAPPLTALHPRRKTSQTDTTGTSTVDQVAVSRSG